MARSPEWRVGSYPVGLSRDSRSSQREGRAPCRGPIGDNECALPPFDLVIRSRGVVLPDGTRPAAVGIRDGKIIEVWPYDAAAVPQAADGTRRAAKAARAATVEDRAAGVRA